MERISYLEYSDRDIKAAKIMLEACLYDYAGRLSQQAIEKRFKHFIEQQGSPSDKRIFGTHNLRKLYKRVCELSNIPEDKTLNGDLASLTDYYYDTNYPQEHGNIELTHDAALEAVRIAEDMIFLVDGLLSQD